MAAKDATETTEEFAKIQEHHGEAAFRIQGGTRRDSQRGSSQEESSKIKKTL
jgi:hypothetical protein